MRRALLVGINYIGTVNELSGCINDIKNIYSFLRYSRNYDQFIILTDDKPDSMPTRENILKGITSLIKDIKAGDELWFHYSGHGTLIRDTNGDEQSGYDSCICPVDFDKSGFISDDLLREIFIIPEGVRLYVVLDACHSGTGCDLRYKYEDFSYYKKTGRPDKYDTNDWILKQTMTQLKNYTKGKGDIFLISGCKDEQTSADAVEDGEATGALTYCFLKVLKSNFGNCKWKIFLKDLNGILKTKGYTQRPVLTSGKQLDTNESMFDYKKKKLIDDIFINMKGSIM